MTISLPALTTHFGGLLDRPAHIATIGPSLLAELAQERLVAVLDSRAVWLPHRLLHPPVNAPPS
jgi:hypothetical protein